MRLPVALQGEVMVQVQDGDVRLSSLPPPQRGVNVPVERQFAVRRREVRQLVAMERSHRAGEVEVRCGLGCASDSIESGLPSISTSKQGSALPAALHFDGNAPSKWTAISSRLTQQPM
jgi:hypothetical protein